MRGRLGSTVTGLKTALTTFVLSTCLAALCACSPGMFGDGKDQDLLKSHSYRKVNPNCSGVDLSQGTLTVDSAKKLLSCLNSNGALEDLWELVDQMPVSDLKPIIDATNRYVLTNRKLLYEMENTYDGLRDSKLLESTLLQLGRLLDNQELVSSALSLMRSAFFIEQPGPGRDGVVDQDLLLALERISTRVTYDNVDNAMKIGLSLSVANSFHQLEQYFKGPVSGGRTLESLAQNALDFLNYGPRKVPSRTLIDAFIDGKVFNLVDGSFGRTPETIAQRVPRQSSVTKVLGGDNASITDGMTSLFHYLNGEVACMENQSYIANGAHAAIDEMVRLYQTKGADEVIRFSKLTEPMTISASNSVCAYPAQLSKYYAAHLRAANSPAIVPMTEMLTVADGIQLRDGEKLSHVIVDLLSDTGEKNDSGVKLLLPILAELTDRGLWDDALYFATLLRDQERPDAIAAVRFLTDPAPELGGQSIQDVMLRAVGRVSAADVARLLRAVNDYFTDEQGKYKDLLASTLDGIRKAYYINDVHPVVDLAREVLRTASTTNADLHRSLFDISELPKFNQAVKGLSAMAKDGRLSDLIGVTATLFHQYAYEGEHEPISVGFAPPYDAVGRLRHNLSGSSGPVAVPGPPTGPCAALDFGLKFNSCRADGWDRQIGNLVDCLRSGGKPEDSLGANALGFLETEPTHDGQSTLLKFNIDLVQELADRLGLPEVLDYAKRTLAQLNDGRLYRLMDALPMLATDVVQGEGDPAPGTVLKPAVDMAKPIVDSPEALSSLRAINDYGASLLKRDEFPSVLGFARDTVNACKGPDPEIEPDPSDDVIRKTRQMLKQYECITDEGQLQMRLAQIKDDYYHSTTSWEWIEGRSRRSWDLGTFRTYLEPVLQKMADKSQAVPEKDVLQATLNVNKYFSLPDNQAAPTMSSHFHADDLYRWFWIRSQDPRPIPYFYPGETTPRVRWVNTLDRMELLLVNSDFAYMLNLNIGLDFLRQLGESFGDEDPSIRPPGSGGKKLKDTYGTMKLVLNIFTFLSGKPSLKCSPPTVEKEAELAKSDIEEVDSRYQVRAAYKKTGGFPPFWLKASLFNTAQLLDVIKENLPLDEDELKTISSGGRLPEYRATMAGGMKVLRDLFYELNSTTPPQYRKMNAEWRNNLSVAMVLARLGVFHEIGNQLKKQPEQDIATRDLFRGIVYSGLKGDALYRLARSLLAGERNHLGIWKLIGRVFYLIDSTSSPEKLKYDLPEKCVDLADSNPRWQRDSAWMQQAAFYLLANTGHFENEQGPTGPLDLIGPTTETLASIASDSLPYLTARADKLANVLTWKTVGLHLRGLYEDADPAHDLQKKQLVSWLRDFIRKPSPKDPALLEGAVAILKAIDPQPSNGGKTWLDHLTGRWDVVSERPEFQDLHLARIGGDMVDFFSEVPPDGAPQTAKIVREYLSDVLLSTEAHPVSKAEELLQAAARDPRGFYEVPEGLAAKWKNGDLKDFFEFMRRNLATRSKNPR